MNTSPSGAAAARVSTWYPRSTASSARTGSTSVIRTRAPRPRAHSAIPAPQEPNPATTTVLPASRIPLARSRPSMTDCPVPPRVVHQPLDGRVAGRDHREGERAFGRHPAQPQHAGGGALAAAATPGQHVRPLRVQRVHQVTAVVDDQVRAVRAQRERDVLVVGLPVDPGAGEDLNAVPGGERGGDVVLGGQRVGRRQRHAGPAGPEDPGQHGRLRRHVQASRDEHPVERPLGGKRRASASRSGIDRSEYWMRRAPTSASSRVGDVFVRRAAVHAGSVTVVVRLVRALDRDADVVGLLLAQRR